MRHLLKALTAALLPTLVYGAVFEARAKCNSDDVLRALRRADGPASTFCSTFTKSPVKTKKPYPTYISAYSTAPARISSACSCLNKPAPTPSCNPGPLGTNVVINSGFDKLDNSKPRNARAVPWAVVKEKNAVIQYAPVEVPNSAPNAATFYFPDTGSAALSQTISVCNGYTYNLFFGFIVAADQAKNGECTLRLDAGPAFGELKILDVVTGERDANWTGFSSVSRPSSPVAPDSPVDKNGRVPTTITMEVSCVRSALVQIDDVQVTPEYPTDDPPFR